MHDRQFRFKQSRLARAGALDWTSQLTITVFITVYCCFLSLFLIKMTSKSKILTMNELLAVNFSSFIFMKWLFGTKEMISYPFAPLLNCTSCHLVKLCHSPFSLSSSSHCLFPSLPTACPSLFLLRSQRISCLSALLSSLICRVTLEVCDTDLLFQETTRGSGLGGENVGVGFSGTEDSC